MVQRVSTPVLEAEVFRHRHPTLTPELMPKYRRAGLRTFYKITDENLVVKILNKESFSQITICKNPIILSDALDESETKEITQTQFDDEYKLATHRVFNQSLDN